MNPNLPQEAPTSCDACGVCCMAEGVPPYMPSELDVLPLALRREIEAAERRGVRRGESCVWLDPKTTRCTHYEDRPEVCRQFSLAGEDCLEIRLEYLRVRVVKG